MRTTRAFMAFWVLMAFQIHVSGAEPDQATLDGLGATPAKYGMATNPSIARMMTMGSVEATRVIGPPSSGDDVNGGVTVSNFLPASRQFDNQYVNYYGAKEWSKEVAHRAAMEGSGNHIRNIARQLIEQHYDAMAREFLAEGNKPGYGPLAFVRALCSKDATVGTGYFDAYLQSMYAVREESRVEVWQGLARLEGLREEFKANLPSHAVIREDGPGLEDAIMSHVTGMNIIIQHDWAATAASGEDEERITEGDVYTIARDACAKAFNRRYSNGLGVSLALEDITQQLRQDMSDGRLDSYDPTTLSAAIRSYLPEDGGQDAIDALDACLEEGMEQYRATQSDYTVGRWELLDARNQLDALIANAANEAAIEQAFQDAIKGEDGLVEYFSELNTNRYQNDVTKYIRHVAWTAYRATASLRDAYALHGSTVDQEVDAEVYAVQEYETQLLQWANQVSWKYGPDGPWFDAVQYQQLEAIIRPGMEQARRRAVRYYSLRLEHAYRAWETALGAINDELTPIVNAKLREVMSTTANADSDSAQVEASQVYRDALEYRMLSIAGRMQAALDGDSDDEEGGEGPNNSAIETVVVGWLITGRGQSSTRPVRLKELPRYVEQMYTVLEEMRIYCGSYGQYEAIAKQSRSIHNLATSIVEYELQTGSAAAQKAQLRSELSMQVAALAAAIRAIDEDRPTDEETSKEEAEEVYTGQLASSMECAADVANNVGILMAMEAVNIYTDTILSHVFMNRLCRMNTNLVKGAVINANRTAGRDVERMARQSIDEVYANVMDAMADADGFLNQTRRQEGHRMAEYEPMSDRPSGQESRELFGTATDQRSWIYAMRKNVEQLSATSMRKYFIVTVLADMMIAAELASYAEASQILR